MSEITGERRLELLRTIREENARNRMNLKNQQSILYGIKYDSIVESENMDTTDLSISKSHSTIFIRILVAVILFILFVIWDYSGKSYININTASVCSYLQDNYSLNIIDFIDKITYTIKDI
ncbi:MAG TPA: hypothetical protein VJY54_02875 [Lachnospiraceae bacterium]|nr:hypothetical protein [Lachnospiraceae bacterium]